MGLRPGDGVDVRFTKWGGGRHWEFAVRLLGEDEHGVWCGAPAGTWLERPGAEFTSAFGWVMLFPARQPWAASYYDSPDQSISVYVDVATPPVWDGSTVTMVDLDLDVVLTRDGDVVVDDEDEFEEHRMSLAYPAEVVALARQSATDLVGAARDGRDPFGAAASAWLPQVGSARS